MPEQLHPVPSETVESSSSGVDQEMTQLHELLEAERLRYRDLFEWAPDAYLVSDPSGRILEANRAAERLLGREREEVVGKPLGGLLARAERPAFELMVDRLANLERISDWELSARLVDGTEVPIAVTVSCIRDGNGKVTSMRWLIRDVTERKQVEEQVVSANIELERRVRERTAALEAASREHEDTLARLQTVLDQIPATIVIADAGGNITTANDQAAELLASVAGTDSHPESWLSLGRRTDGTVYLPEERPLSRALRGETVSCEQIELERLDGTRGVFELSAAPVCNADGDVVSAVAAYWDITDRERRARAAREFVTNAAHELRTPLAALASAVEVLQAGAKNDPGDRERFLSHVDHQCMRLQRLVRSLLLLARAQTGQGSPETEVIDVHELLDQVAAQGPRARIQIDVRCPRGTGVVANRDLAEQALLNLVANAAKYAPESEIVLSGVVRNGYVSLEVIDTGPGISPDERERVADRFYRGHESGEVEGFGLGLSIASQVAEALDGKLEIGTVEPAGTCARLLLPAAANA